VKPTTTLSLTRKEREMPARRLARKVNRFGWGKTLRSIFLTLQTLQSTICSSSVAKHSRAHYRVTSQPASWRDLLPVAVVGRREFVRSF
jgi:hypothetical protein